MHDTGTFIKTGRLRETVKPECSERGVMKSGKSWAGVRAGVMARRVGSRCSERGNGSARSSRFLSGSLRL